MLDVIFLSYDEPNCEENWERVLSVYPEAKRVHGVKGILKAHQECVRISKTDHFFVIDGDAYILDGFKFETPTEDLKNNTYIWRSRNAVNMVAYSNGGVKIVPKSLFDCYDWGIDVYLTIKKEGLIQMNQVASETRFNTSPFHTWRAAFRECIVLSSKEAEGLEDKQREFVLKAWCLKGADRPFGKWCILGARQGKEYGEKHKGNVEALKKMNDYGWLKRQFEIAKEKIDSV